MSVACYLCIKPASCECPTIDLPTTNSTAHLKRLNVGVPHMNSNAFLFGLVVTLAALGVGPLDAQDTLPVRRLTFDPAQEGFPSWAPDGSTIVYSLGSRDNPSMTGLWKVPSAGGEARQFTDFIAEHPDWSPDGHYIVFDADSGNAIRLVSSRGGQPIRIVPETIPVFRGGNPNWSPDSRRIAFREESNLWVLDIRTGAATVVFSQAGTYPIPGCWSRDGETIYVTVRDIETYASAIWKIPVDGSERLRLTSDEDRPYRYMDLSPDGALLAYVACEDRDCDIWVMPADGGQSIQLTNHPAYDDTPRWSPDGTQIAFTSTRAEGFDVWIMELDIDGLEKALESAQE